MQGYEIVKDRDGRLSIGMFPSSDEPHHADHDGDEGNFHFPIGIEEEAEVKVLMNAKYNIMCRGSHRPSVATIMDTLTGSHLLSYFDKIFRQKDAMEMLMMVEGLDLNKYLERTRLFGLHPFSGRAIFSAILPTERDGITQLFQYQHDGIFIINSVLTRGSISKDNLGQLYYNNRRESLTKSHLGTSHRSLIQDIYKQYGGTITSNFISTLFKIITYYMTNVQDISAGIMDCVSRVPGRTRKLVDNKIADILLHIESLGPIPDKETDAVAYSLYQKDVGMILDTVDALGIKLVEDVLKEGSVLGYMLKGYGSGAKGTKENIAQIEGALSQQHVGGKRPEFPETGPQRCLNFYEEGERPLDVRSKGFIKSSFIEGLAPDEFFMHGMSSREGIVASKTSTPDSGDLQRKMVMFFQNLIVQYDGTVRNGNGKIVQMMYGDGFDPELMIEVKLGRSKKSKVHFIDPHIEVRNANSEAGWILIDENNL
jgi:DNA-directed RNA polymerase beta' subunit